MTEERAIRIAREFASGGVCTLREGEAQEYHKRCLDALLSKLENKNAQLTLDELRLMSGDPVWVVTDRLKEWCIVHSHHSDDVIGGGIIMTRRTAEKRTYQYYRYGEDWIAYRHKPEEGTV